MKKLKSPVLKSNRQVLISLVEVVEDKLKTINDYPMLNEFVRGEKESFEFTLKYLKQTLKDLDVYENNRPK